jgi:hypothetical protein
MMALQIEGQQWGGLTRVMQLLNLSADKVPSRATHQAAAGFAALAAGKTLHNPTVYNMVLPAHAAASALHTIFLKTGIEDWAHSVVFASTWRSLSLRPSRNLTHRDSLTLVRVPRL